MPTRMRWEKSLAVYVQPGWGDLAHPTGPQRQALPDLHRNAYRRGRPRLLAFVGRVRVKLAACGRWRRPRGGAFEGRPGVQRRVPGEPATAPHRVLPTAPYMVRTDAPND